MLRACPNMTLAVEQDVKLLSLNFGHGVLNNVSNCITFWGHSGVMGNTFNYHHSLSGKVGSFLPVPKVVSLYIN